MTNPKIIEIDDSQNDGNMQLDASNDHMQLDNNEEGKFKISLGMQILFYHQLNSCNRRFQEAPILPNRFRRKWYVKPYSHVMNYIRFIK